MTDTYKEHGLHYDYDSNCSECYKEKQAALKLFGARLQKLDNSPRGIEWGLLEEKSLHPEENYW